ELRRTASVASVDSQITLVDWDAQLNVVRSQRQARPNSQFTIGTRRVIVCS
ncbi:hypothetical protein IWW54_003755, partial [Coemansia sp. RSA 2705]